MEDEEGEKEMEKEKKRYLIDEIGVNGLESDGFACEISLISQRLRLGDETPIHTYSMTSSSRISHFSEMPNDT